MRRRPVRRSNQPARTVIEHHARRFGSVVAPLAGPPAHDEADFGAGQVVGVQDAEFRALAQAGGGGFFGRKKKADEQGRLSGRRGGESQSRKQQPGKQGKWKLKIEN